MIHIEIDFCVVLVYLSFTRYLKITLSIQQVIIFDITAIITVITRVKLDNIWIKVRLCE